MPVDSAIPDYILESVRSLPPLPAAVNKLLTLARDPEADFREIALVIETDQTLTARTLKAANSAFYGLPRRVDTVRQASLLIGRESLLSLAVGASLASLQENIKRPWPLEPLAFWRHSAAVAATARALARRMRLAEAESAFVAGLLHDIGKLILQNHFGDTYDQILLAAQYGARPLHLLEREIIGTDHAVVGHALCLHWSLPPTLTRAIAEHHDETAPAPDSVAEVVRDANELVKVIRFGNGGNPYVELHASRLLPHRRLPPYALRELILSLPGEVHATETVLGLHDGEVVASEPDERSVVHVNVTHAEEREVICLLLLSHGCEPVVVSDAATHIGGDGAGLSVRGLISDLPVEPARSFAYAQYGLQILDYARWRSEHGQPLEGFLDVAQLHGWIEENLVSAPVSVAA